jgi:hypothetical protein
MHILTGLAISAATMSRPDLPSDCRIGTYLRGADANRKHDSFPDVTPDE